LNKKANTDFARKKRVGKKDRNYGVRILAYLGIDGDHNDSNIGDEERKCALLLRTPRWNT